MFINVRSHIAIILEGRFKVNKVLNLICRTALLVFMMIFNATILWGIYHTESVFALCLGILFFAYLYFQLFRKDNRQKSSFWGLFANILLPIYLVLLISYIFNSLSDKNLYHDPVQEGLTMFMGILICVIVIPAFSAIQSFLMCEFARLSSKYLD